MSSGLQKVSGTDLGNNWIDHFNSPVNQMVYRSMAVPCLSLGTPAQSLGGAQGLPQHVNHGLHASPCSRKPFEI